MKNSLTIIFGLIVTTGLCCDCHSSLFQPFQKSDFDKADLIYLVQIGRQLDSGVFEVKLIESFKGEFRPTTKIINAKDDLCSKFVKSGQKWLVYSSDTKGDSTTIYGCSRSRDIEKTKYWVPPPPLLSNDEKKSKELAAKYANSDKGHIEDELKQLRALKANGR